MGDTDTDRRLELNNARQRTRIIATLEMAIPPMKMAAFGTLMVMYGSEDQDMLLELLTIFLMFLVLMAILEFVMALLLIRSTNEDRVVTRPAICKQRVLIWLTFSGIAIIINVILAFLSTGQLDVQFWLALLMFKNLFFMLLVSSFWSELKWVVEVNKMLEAEPELRINTVPAVSFRKTMDVDVFLSEPRIHADIKCDISEAEACPEPRGTSTSISTDTSASSNPTRTGRSTGTSASTDSSLNLQKMKAKPKPRPKPKRKISIGSSTKSNISSKKPNKRK